MPKSCLRRRLSHNTKFNCNCFAFCKFYKFLFIDLESNDLLAIAPAVLAPAAPAVYSALVNKRHPFLWFFAHFSVPNLYAWWGVKVFWVKLRSSQNNWAASQWGIYVLEIAKALGHYHRTVKKLSLAPLSEMDVLTREKFGSKHLFCIKLCVRSRRKSGVTICNSGGSRVSQNKL